MAKNEKRRKSLGPSRENTGLERKTTGRAIAKPDKIRAEKQAKRIDAYYQICYYTFAKDTIYRLNWGADLGKTGRIEQ